MNTVAAKPKRLGELIQYYRQKKEMSLSKLQEAVGLDKGSLSRIENSEIKRPDFQSILSIAAVLDVPHNDIVEQYIEIGHKSEVIYAILQNELTTLEHPSLIRKIAAKFLESPNEDSLDAVEKLYRTIDSVNNLSTQLSLYTLIVDYSRAHGIIPYIAKGLFQKYMIVRNDFSRLQETYQLGKNVLDYVDFLNGEERVILYYLLGVHAFSLLKYDESIRFSKYVIEHDIPHGEHRANAIFNACNSHYYLDDYESSNLYLAEYRKFPFTYIEDNVKLMSGCLSGRTGNIDLGIEQLEKYLTNPSNYNLIYAITMLMDLYLIKRNYSSAKLLMKFEPEMEAFLQDHRTTPDKRSKLALYYKLKGDLLAQENIEEALDCYIKSAMEYMNLSLQSKAFETFSFVTKTVKQSSHFSQKAIQKLNDAFICLS
ncbi:helix-turn-helix domain-containing protein [Paenibacillus popilliae]|uniref:Predicted transcriptional regulator n=1 Tax=Paenibacillus popilliae ATCC 14706 TaxID=1212764 RepID=M9M6S2_PAEPP|nr:helix-turn-helix transcriptional regulator [Paenibacillus popilliae]GAC43288.1 predicted transcriptional regulator [Paenibacillus popilliae ATCC 14706]